MNVPRTRIKAEYSNLTNLGARVETKKNWGIERNRLVLTNVKENEVAGQQKGIRVLTGLTAKAQKAAGKAIDIEIDGTTLTVNKASFIKWCQRTSRGLELLDKPIVFDSKFIQTELKKHILERPSVSALLDNSNPEAQKAAMSQVHAMHTNAANSSRQSSSQPSPVPAVVSTSSSPKNTSVTSDSQKSAIPAAVPQKLPRSYASAVTEGVLPTVDPHLVDNFTRLNMRNLNSDADETTEVAPAIAQSTTSEKKAKPSFTNTSPHHPRVKAITNQLLSTGMRQKQAEATALRMFVREQRSDFQEVLTRATSKPSVAFERLLRQRKAPVKDHFSSVDPAMVAHLEAQMDGLKEGEVPQSFGEVLGNVGSIEELHQAAIGTKTVNEALVTEDDGDEALDKIHQELLLRLSKQKDDEEIEAIQQFFNTFQQSDVEQTQINSSANEVEIATSKDAEPTAAAPTRPTDQPTKVVKSKKSRRLSAPAFIMLTVATTTFAVACLALWGMKDLNTTTLTPGNLASNFSTNLEDFGAAMSQMGQATSTYACETFHYLRSEQCQFDVLRSLLDTNKKLFDFVQSQESFSSFLSNTTQTGYDMVAPTARILLNQTADSVQFAVNGLSPYAQQAKEKASELLNNTIIPIVQPVLETASNGICNIPKSVQNFFVRPDYVMNHVAESWKDYMQSGGLLPRGIPETGTSPINPPDLRMIK